MWVIPAAILHNSWPVDLFLRLIPLCIMSSLIMHFKTGNTYEKSKEVMGSWAILLRWLKIHLQYLCCIHSLAVGHLIGEEVYARTIRQNQITQYFWPNTLIEILQQCCRGDFYKIWTHWTFLCLLSEWLKEND